MNLARRIEQLSMLVDLLTNGIASHPAISVVDGPSINYGELARQVDDLSKTLGKLGLGKSDRIAMALPNGLEVIALFLAASAAGTAAPLNPAYTRDEFIGLGISSRIVDEPGRQTRGAVLHTLIDERLHFLEFVGGRAIGGKTLQLALDETDRFGHAIIAGGAAWRRPFPFNALLDLNDDRTFRDDRRIRVDIRRILLNPFARDFQAFIGACLVLANSHRHAALRAAHQRIAQEARNFPESSFDLGLLLFQHVEKLLRAGT